MTAAEHTTMAIELLDPRELAAHPRNVRSDLGDLTGLTASIAAQGVIEPITVVPLADGGHQVVAGHRRTAAAIAAGLEQVPCVIRADLAAGVDDSAGQAVHIGAMLAENLHREGLTAVEEARGVQAMLNLGVSITKVSKSTGLDRKRVALAAGVARLDDETAKSIALVGMDLEQAAGVALFADDPETASYLVGQAAHGPGSFAHALERAKQDRANAIATAELIKELEAAGRTVLADDAWRTGGADQLWNLRGKKENSQLEPKDHADCPGSAVVVQTTYNGPSAVEVCTNPGKYGHAPRWGGAVKATPETPEEKEAATAERRRVIENNKAMAAANATRRAWLKEYLARRTAPKEALRFAVEEIAANPSALHRWLSSESPVGDKDADAAMGLQTPVLPWSMGSTEKRITLTSGEQVADGRLALQLLAHIAGGLETGIDKSSWRRTTIGGELPRWLTFLAGQGYTLSDVEQLIVDGAAK